MTRPITRNQICPCSQLLISRTFYMHYSSQCRCCFYSTSCLERCLACESDFDRVHPFHIFGPTCDILISVAETALECAPTYSNMHIFCQSISQCKEQPPSLTEARAVPSLLPTLSARLTLAQHIPNHCSLSRKGESRPHLDHLQIRQERLGIRRNRT